MAKRDQEYPYNVGDDLADSDWIKAVSWDFIDDEGIITHGVDRLLVRLELTNAEEEVQQGELRGFLRLPAAQAMPPRLRKEVDKFIREGRTRDASS